MAETVTEGDLRLLVELVEESRVNPSPVGLPEAAFDLAQKLVNCDELSFLEYNATAHRYYLDQDRSESIADPVYRDTGPDPFWVHFWDCRPCSYSVLTGDQRTVTTISDFYSQRQWHQTGMYVDCLGTYPVEHSAIINFSSPVDRARRLIFFRGGGSDFDQRDRLLLALLRPHLNELYQDLQRRRQLDQGLTERQRQVLQLVAAGYSNGDIARELVVSAATVRTHLEHIFKQLDVTNRSAAVAKAFPLMPL